MSPDPNFPNGIKELHECDEAIVDICFVHGLAGDRENTWTAEGEAAPWPQKLLPTALPSARILTFGYDAYFVPKKGVASGNGLYEHATNLMNDLVRNRTECNATSRPLIFVAHSLGGVVTKKAILLSQNDPAEHLHDVFDSVIGIAFMGTPHWGSWMANLGKIPLKALGVVKSSNTQLLKVLCTTDRVLEDLRKDFLRMITAPKPDGRLIQVTCFNEELPLFGSTFVVPRNSATMGDNVAIFSIWANHRNMVRFVSVDDVGFNRLLGELKRWVAQNIIPPKTEPMSPEMNQANMDCLASLRFDGMGMRYRTIDRAVKGTCAWLLDHEKFRQWTASGRRLLWIKGNPGSGKSTLVKYAYEQCPGEDNRVVLFFFFHDRGSDLQKTPLGFFRSLAHQLLTALPTTVTDLVDAYKFNHPQEYGGADKNWAWEEQDLQDYVALALLKVLEARPVWLFVDALDESGEENAGVLFEWLEDLLPALSGTRFPCRFCVSCRHYPVISSKDVTLDICTEKENTKDIATYVKGRLAHTKSAYMFSSDIPGLIIERASGSFLWARLVVDHVLDADRKGKTLNAVRNIVKDIPEDLNKLYARLIEGAVAEGDPDCLRLMECVFVLNIEKYVLRLRKHE